MSTQTPVQYRNTNRWDTRQLVTMALMCAVGAIFQFVQIPIMPAIPVLAYDPSLVPATVCGLAYGPGPGIVVGVLATVIHALVTGDWVGGLMNVVATIGFVLPVALVYRRRQSRPAAIAGIVASAACATVLAIAANLTIGVLFWYGSTDAIAPLVLPVLLPFNLIKTVLNAVLTLVVHGAVGSLVAPQGRKGTGRA